MHFEPPLPPESREEVVGSVCATVLGAAESASEELGLGAPRKIAVVSEDGEVTIMVDERGAAVMLEKRASKKPG
jgi:predicted regulator of Ras-like GTPase activity (Roadblock/LC7/MglB family)